ncbi:hypothetical protein JYU16_01575, partial [bacterium AH-315-M05]|nr:hypothetical protein [bacterium AH-315-M05]
MKKLLFTAALAGAIALNANAQVTFQKTYGETSFEERGYSVQQTADGGYIMTGELRWVFGEGNGDVFLVKTDANGDTMWTKVYGGPWNEYGKSVDQTADGGYIVAGYTQSFGAGGWDIYLIRTDLNGDTIWTKTYGGSGSEYGYSVQQTADGGFIVTGSTSSYGAGSGDVYLIKTDANGDTLWTKTYGESGLEFAYSVRQTTDLGYIITGGTNSFGAGSYDVYLIKTDANGDTLWTKTYGGTGSDYAWDVQQTADNGYVIIGGTAFGTGGDVYLIRTDANGDTLWTKTYGSAGYEEGYSVQQTTDGGYIIGGYTDMGAGGGDYYLVKTDAGGNVIWSKSYGGSDWEDGTYSVQQTTDEGYVLLGYGYSFGYALFHLVKTDSIGNSGLCYERNVNTITTSPPTIVSSTGTLTGAGTIVNNTGTVPNNTAIEVNNIIGLSLTTGSTPESIGNNDGSAWVMLEGGTSPYTYQWYDPDSQTTVIASDLTAGNYTVVVNDNAGCLDSAVVTVNVGLTPVKFQKGYGLVSTNVAYSVDHTSDGGYIFTGKALSAGIGSDDVYLVKTDANGDTLWTRIFGGTGSDIGRSVQQTSDGGYIIAGYTYSYGSGFPDADVYLIKTDISGNMLWSKLYSGPDADMGYSVKQTGDGGYIIAGRTVSYGAGGFGSPDDFYLIKTDANGDTLWTKTYGGTKGERAYSVQQTSDGGYIVTGATGTFASDINDDDVYLIKTDANGDTLWTRVFGGVEYDYGYSVQQTSDGGYLVAGLTRSFGVGGTCGSFICSDVYLIKVDPAGTTLWTKTYGGTGDDEGRSVQETVDGAYIIAGYRDSSAAGGDEVYLIKTMPNGDTLWTKVYGGTSYEWGYSVQQATDEGYIIAGTSAGFRFGGGSNVYLIKTDANGNSGTCHEYSTNTTVTDAGDTIRSTATLVGSGAIVSVPATITLGTGTTYGEILLSTSTTAINVSCKGDSTGDAIVTVAGGKLAYTYLWDDPNTQITDTATALSAGLYHVSVTDNWGCTVSDSVTITEPTALLSSVIGTDVNCKSGNDGAANLSVTGGVAPYSYLWSNTDTTEDINILTAGTYTVVTTDSNGCTINDTIIINEPGDTLMATTNILTGISCNGVCDGSITSNATGGTSPYTYFWDGGLGAGKTHLGNVCDGTYNVTITDNNGCTASDSLTINEPLLLTTTMTKTDVSCNGLGDGTATVTPSGGTSPYNYLWNIGQTDSTAVGLFPDNYSVNVFDNNGCIATDIVTISEPTALGLSVTTINATCGNSNGSATASVTGGINPYTYAWSSGGSNSTETGMAAGSYTITVTDNNGCTIDDSITINAPLPITTGITATDISCNGGNDGSADLTVSGGTPPYTFLWSNSQTTEDITGLTAGTYSVTVTDNSGCATANDTVNINEPAVLTSTITGTDVSCNGGGDGTATVTPSGGTPPYNYNWNNGQTSSTAIALFPGSYGVNVFDSNGCLASNNITITEPTALVSSLSGTIDVICIGDSSGSATVS